MSFIKYADAPILGIAQDRKSFRRLASSGVKFDYDPKDGFIYLSVRGISSRVNDNSDGFVPAELEAHWDTFKGCPHFIEHDNANWRKARGIVVDAKFHPDDAPVELLASQKDSFDGRGRYNPIIWTPGDHLDAYAKIGDELAVNFGKDNWVELLVEVDAQKYPVYGQALLEGKISTFSMGCDVNESYCSICGNKASMPSEYCTHIGSKKGQWLATADGMPKIYAYEDNRGISFFEISAVRSPADASATLLDLDSCLQSAACDMRLLGHTLCVLGEEVLDRPGVNKSLAYRLLAEAHRPTVDRDAVAELLDAIAEQI